MDLTTHGARVTFARNNSAVMSLIDDKILAIAALRDASEGHKVSGSTKMLLSEARDAIDEIRNF